MIYHLYDLQQGFDSSAQQGGMMSGHRSDDQNFRVVALDVAFEMQEMAEGLLNDVFFGNLNSFAADHRERQIK